eukprot:2115577-Rhodomonas_salina.1
MDSVFDRVRASADHAPFLLVKNGACRGSVETRLRAWVFRDYSSSRAHVTLLPQHGTCSPCTWARPRSGPRARTTCGVSRLCFLLVFDFARSAWVLLQPSTGRIALPELASGTAVCTELSATVGRGGVPGCARSHRPHVPGPAPPTHTCSCAHAVVRGLADARRGRVDSSAVEDSDDVGAERRLCVRQPPRASRPAGARRGVGDEGFEG